MSQRHDMIAATMSGMSPLGHTSLPRNKTAEIPPEVLFARDFVNEHQVLGRPVACHGDNCGFLSPDALPGQEFAVGAAYDLLFGYFVRQAQKMRLPSPFDPDDEEEDDEDTEEFEEPLKTPERNP